VAAVNARFTADFSSFVDAVDKADFTLKQFDGDVGKVGDRLGAMTYKFSGTQVAEQATLMVKAIENVGGATKLTADEQDRAASTLQTYIDKQTALGNAIPPSVTALHDQFQALEDTRQAQDESAKSAQAWAETLKGAIKDPTEALKGLGTSFVDLVANMGPVGQAAAAIGVVLSATAGAMIEVASAAVETGEKIHDITEITGMSAPAVSALKFAFESAGGSVDGLNTLLYMFQQRMDTASPKVEAGLQKIGLSLAQIEAMPADQRILAISDALRAAGDDTNKAAVAMELFGKQGRDNLPLLLKPLSDLSDHARELGAVWTDEDAKAAAEFTLRQRELETQSKATWDALGMHLTLGEELILVWDRMKLAVANLAYDWVSALQGLVTFGGYLPIFIDQLNGVAEALPKIGGPAAAGVAHAFDTTATALKPVTLGTAELSRVEKEETEAAKQSMEAHKKAAEAADAAAKKAAEALAKYNEVVSNVMESAQGFGVVVDTIDGAVVEGARDLVAHGASLQDVGKMYGLTSVQIHALGEEFKFEQTTADDTAKTFGKVLQTHQALLPTVASLTEESHNLNAGLDDSTRIAHEADVEQNQLNDTLKIQTTTRNTLNDAIAKQTIALPGLGSAITQESTSWTDSLKVSDKEIQELTTGFKDLAQVSGGSFKGMVQDIGNVVASFGLAQKAVEQFNAATTAAGKVTALISGGAAVLQATSTGGVGTRMLGGAATGAALGGGIGESLGVPGGKLIGEGIGAAAGAVTGLVRGLTGGPSQAEKDARTLEAQYEQSFGGFQQMVQAVGDAYAATGKTMGQAQADVKSLLDAEKQGPAATQQWIDTLNAATTAAQLKGAKDAFIDAAGGLDTLTTKAWQAGTSVDALMAAKTTDQMNASIKSLNDAFTFQQQALDGVVKTAQKYGITLNELGPALQKQELDKQAQQIYADFQTLTAAGIDTKVVIDHMSAATNDYVHNALAMGQEVPDAMQPMLEKMAEAGELTDANGNKITDLSQSGIQFSMTMTEGFTKMIASVDKLTTVLSRSLGGAIQDTTTALKAMPTTVDVAVKYTASGDVPGAPTQNVPGFQEGTDGKFIDFGSGSLVMLHGKEAVVPQDTPLAPGVGLSVGATTQAPVVNIVIHAQGAFFDTPGDLQRLANKVNDALTAKYGLQGNRLRAA
jgi:hypothetical protein